MVAIPQEFPPGAEQAIASYDFTEISSGTGYSNFYPAASTVSGAATYLMATDTSITSGEAVKKLTGAANASTIDYDVIFNLPQRVKGKVILSYATGAAYGNGTCNMHTRAKLYKLDVNGNAKLLDQEYATNLITATVGDTLVTSRNLIQFDLTDKVRLFKKGEGLRVNIYMSMGGGSQSTAGYAQDPSGSADTTEGSALQVIDTGYSTTMTLAIPFVLDL